MIQMPFEQSRAWLVVDYFELMLIPILGSPFDAVNETQAEYFQKIISSVH